METRSFEGIREWDGSQDRAFEELCYQLRDATPDGAELRKTGDPDAGYEWYVRLADGAEWGWQAKNTTDIEVALKLMERSLRTVCEKRPRCRRLTFCIPFDLPDGIEGPRRKSARQKFEDRKRSWRERIEGADRITVELTEAGKLLERLTAHPNQKGIELFFWNRECFSESWCRRRLETTVDVAGRRYSPKLHVDLPIAFCLDGLAGSDRFWDQYRSHRGLVADEIRKVGGLDETGVGVDDEMARLRRRLREWELGVQEEPDVVRGLDLEPATTSTRQALEAVEQAFPPLPDGRPEDTAARRLEIESSALDRKLTRLLHALMKFTALVESDAARARQTNAVLMSGDAGQGKTHLFCDAGHRLLDQGHPSLVMLGSRFRGSGPWGDICEQVGLGDVGLEALIGAMAAAGEAADRPFVLLIDALNESGHPPMWLEELPAMLADASSSPWIAIGFSYRSSFEEVIVRSEGVGPCATPTHRGFAGREVEATEGFFEHFGLQAPRVPLLLPEFLNPLFLKLYCEGVTASEDHSADDHPYISEVFDRFLRTKEIALCRRLSLDRRSRPLRTAIDLLSSEMVATRSEYVSYHWATDAFGALAPSRDRWPDTLLGVLLSEGVLSRDLVWIAEDGDHEEVVRLTYQRLSDYRAADAILREIPDTASLEGELASSGPLRAVLTSAPAGWIEALSVRMPELFDVELPAPADRALDSSARRTWNRAFITSVAARRPDAVGSAAIQRLRDLSAAEADLAEKALEVALQVAVDPSHPLNAKHLHERLMCLPLADRDTSWSRQTYFAFDEEGPLKRILRWAARGPHLDCPEEVAELAVLTLAWTMTSPHRRLRDYATKVLVVMLAPRLGMARALLQQFRGVDDPYVLERLAAIAYAAILTGGESAPADSMRLAEELRRFVLEDERIPNLVARDAVRGAHEWCVRHGLSTSADLAEVSPPYGSPAPEEPRSEQSLREEYVEQAGDQAEGRVRSEYAALYFSLFSMGDFGRYVVGSRVHDFSEFPLKRPYPAPRDESEEVLEEFWQKIEQNLDEETVKKLAENPLEVIDALDHEDATALLGAVEPRRRRPEYPGGHAVCWIFERVLELGWSPERFDEWETTFVRPRDDRSGHKIERFGKKYQWIALSELLARIADNFHMVDAFGGDPRTYAGPWQFFGRDIDPTLPPAPIAPEHSREYFEETFPPDHDDSWWVPPGPTFAGDDPAPDDEWASRTADIPGFESLARRNDPGGRPWVVLQAYLNWDEPRDEGDGDVTPPRRRDLWTHLKSWLVRREDRAANVAYLKDKSFMNHWMPQGHEVTDAAYLGEMPWSASANEYPTEWTQVEGPSGETPPDGLELYPAWVEYMWEGSVQDCSIDSSARAVMPAPLLFEAGSLRWRPGTTEWVDGEDLVVARHLKSQGHSALAVDENWLTGVLRANGWSLIVGWLGEKQLFGGHRSSPELIGSWTEINGVAELEDGRWRFHGPRFDEQLPVR